MNQVTGGGSTVRRMQLGARLRALRRAAGLSREEAGHPIRASESKISRMELGRVGFKERDIADLLTLYGVHDHEERLRLLAFVTEANSPSWWHAYGDVLDTWLQTYLDFEEGAELHAAHRRAAASYLIHICPSAESRPPDEMLIRCPGRPQWRSVIFAR